MKNSYVTHGNAILRGLIHKRLKLPSWVTQGDVNLYSISHTKRKGPIYEYNRDFTSPYVTQYINGAQFVPHAPEIGRLPGDVRNESCVTHRASVKGWC